MRCSTNHCSRGVNINTVHFMFKFMLLFFLNENTCFPCSRIEPTKKCKSFITARMKLQQSSHLACEFSHSSRCPFLVFKWASRYSTQQEKWRNLHLPASSSTVQLLLNYYWRAPTCSQPLKCTFTSVRMFNHTWLKHFLREHSWVTGYWQYCTRLI